MPHLSVLICDSSYIVRKGLADLLEELEGDLTIREAGDSETLLSLLEYTDPDIVIINPSVFEAGSFPVDLMLKGDRKKVIGLSFCSNSQNNRYFIETIYLNDPKSTVLEKVRKVAGRSETGSSGKGGKGFEITDREKLIVRYIALGLTNREIAEKLFISTHTVVTHRKNITRKLGIKTVSGLTVYAILNNLINMDEINK